MIATSIQNFIFFDVLNFDDLSFFITKIEIIRIDNTRATTPPSLDGILRRITYANKKYHSGWMWIGATKGLAGLKFSTSPNMFGLFDDNKIINSIIIIIGRESFTVKIGLNFTLSKFVWEFVGLEDPFSCNIIKWIITKTTITIGNKKCKEKNRFKVGCDTEGPPHTHVTKSFPMIGIADITPVITVAPQNDICPHGNTYPRNAVAITINIIITPDIHTFGLFAGEEK